MDRIKKIIVTGFGTGYLPVAPGTWASAATAGVFCLLAWSFAGAGLPVNLALGAIVVLATLGCGLLGRWAEKAFGGKDPSQCTLDEWAGQALTYLLLPLGNGYTGWLTAAGVGFVAFRLFDILKPPPARQLESLPHGWGVVADDLAAGVYANILSQVILRLWLI